MDEETGPGLEVIDPRASKGGTYTPQEGVTVGAFKHHPAYKPNNDTHEASVRAALTPGPITDLILECHLSAWNAGWWHNVTTGKLLDRNAGEMMLLQCSELGEAADGLDNKLNDDKLPHRQMVEVELADFNIRLFDYCGGLRLDLQHAVSHCEAHEQMYTSIHPNPQSTPALWQMVRHILRAMEAHRKNRTAEHVQSLARAYRLGTWYAANLGLDIEGARIEKMAFNKVRPDHQRSARAADGGKRY